jgi:Chaperone of endosialidase
MADHPFTGTLSVTGNVGIGVEPLSTATLYIRSSTSKTQIRVENSECGSSEIKNQILVENSTGALLKISLDDGEVAIETEKKIDLEKPPRLSLSLKTNGSTHLSINDAGNVGIGTTSFPQQLSITGGIGFANQNAVDKKLYSPVDGVLEWMTHDWAGQHGFAVSHQGDQRVFLNTNGNSHFNGGNVGIGTNTPTHKFHVVAYDAVGLLESSGNQAFLRLSTNEGFDNRVEITNRPGGRFTVWTAGAGDGFNITKDGNVGIGTLTPSEKLDVAGNLRIGNSLYVTNLPYADRRNVQWDDRTKQFCYDNSSQRNKENITPLADEFTKLLAVEPKTYTRPDFPDTWEIGYIAEEFHDLGLDKLVYYNEDGSPGGINYPKIGLYLLEILKKHEQKFQEYEEKIDRLEQQLSSS